MLLFDELALKCWTFKFINPQLVGIQCILKPKNKANQKAANHQL
jgi:hypothetical protein